MNKETKDLLYADFRRISNFIRKTVKYHLTKGRKQYALLESNRDLKGCLRGKRCFIIGNGPSLKQQDLEGLRDEVVFTVNQAARHDFYEKIHSNFHLWTDPNLFVIEEGSSVDSSIVDLMREVKTQDNNPICFFPLEQVKFVEKYSLDKTLNIYYLSPELGWLYEGFEEVFDLERPIPVFGTVVQYAICAAIYMQASEIYLLGCDNTGIINSVNSLLDENDGSNYGYHVSTSEIVRMRRTAERNGLELDSLAYYNNLKSYRLLYNYCTNRNVKLINCSARTVIDCIPRMDLRDVLRKKQ